MDLDLAESLGVGIHPDVMIRIADFSCGLPCDLRILRLWTF